jgi:4-carboxymuconolactone decarboxylase
MRVAPRTEQARLKPVAPEDFDPVVTELLGRTRPKEFGQTEQPIFNIFKTLANYPELMKRLAPWGNHVLFKSSLPPRIRELIILRAGWLCQAAYEWSHHVDIGLETAGLAEADIVALTVGPDDPHWSGLERLALLATDALHADQFIPQPLWTALAEQLTAKQMMDLVFAVGHYSMMCMALNSFGVQLEADAP